MGHSQTSPKVCYKATQNSTVRYTFTVPPPCQRPSPPLPCPNWLYYDSRSRSRLTPRQELKKRPSCREAAVTWPCVSTSSPPGHQGRPPAEGGGWHSQGTRRLSGGFRSLPTRGANGSPKFRNSEIVWIPIRHSDGQQLIFPDNFGHSYQCFKKVNVTLFFFKKKNTYQVKTQYMKHTKTLGAMY